MSNWKGGIWKTDPLAYRREYNRRWRANNPKALAFCRQRSNAQERGIIWCLTQQEWITWWGEDFAQRGRSTPESLQMCRYGDTGPYALDNIYKATLSENMRGPRHEIKV